MKRLVPAPTALVLLVRAALATSLLMLAGGLLGWVSEAAAADGPQGAPSLVPEVVQAAGDPFTLVPPADARCEDDGTPRSGSAGWRWHSFIVEAGRDLATLDFGGTGPGTDFDATDGQITAGLIASGRGVFNEPPAEQPPGMVNPNSLAGLTLDPADYTLRDGQYILGFACTDEASTTRQWWSIEVTVQTGAAPFMTAGSTAAAPTDAAGATSTTAAVGAAPTDPGASTTVASTAAPGPDASPAITATSSQSGGTSGSRGVSWAPLVALTDASSVLPVAAWAVLVVLFARIAYLLARPVRVLAPITP